MSRPPLAFVDLMDSSHPLLLYDGTCGFCARSVQFVLQHEGADRTLRFASLQSGIARAIIARHPELASIDSVIWVERGAAGEPRVLVRSAAVLRVLRYLGGVWRVVGAGGRIVPRALRDALYDFIARHRYRIARPDPSCLLPTPEQRARFIEIA